MRRQTQHHDQPSPGTVKQPTSIHVTAGQPKAKLPQWPALCYSQDLCTVRMKQSTLYFTQSYLYGSSFVWSRLLCKPVCTLYRNCQQELLSKLRCSLPLAREPAARTRLCFLHTVCQKNILSGTHK